ncbi:MAG: 3-phosphoshikimate 1-carboxyvinyltransferase [Cytophagales bacterium]|nr:MAG: 3-phosphoshikimate 1-carboxyvinyltransferase [Cytophagales bacterium]
MSSNIAEPITIVPPNEPHLGEKTVVQLPSSKSESNRALIIQAAYPNIIRLENISTAHDTQLLQQLLHTEAKTINAEDAGTTFRFLTAFYALSNQKKIITGTERMQQRPIGILVDALRQLGAHIHYTNKEGYPPLQLDGYTPNDTTTLEMPAHISSQFISAVLMGAPLLKKNITIHLKGNISSLPYILMTVAQMQQSGIHVEWQPNTQTLHIRGNNIPQPTLFSIENDWSAASYWYLLFLLGAQPQEKLLLRGLKKNSLQGDSQIANLMQPFGIHTHYHDEGISLEKNPHSTIPTQLNIDFTPCPDLAQTLMIAAATKGTTLVMQGLESLKIKETDRIAAMRTELSKIGTLLEEKNNHWLLKPATLPNLWTTPLLINTYQDHRMAMAFAPLAFLHPLQIENSAVVRKSYPHFWNDLATTSLKIMM